MHKKYAFYTSVNGKKCRVSLRTRKQRRRHLENQSKSANQIQAELNAFANKCADKMRSAPTEAEQVLFDLLSETLPRHKIRFLFQHVIAGKIVDFYLPEQRLIIEVDGGYHYFVKGQIGRDRQREAKISTKGRRVVRFDNEEIINFPANVISEILKQCGKAYEVRIGDM